MAHCNPSLKPVLRQDPSLPQDPSSQSAATEVITTSHHPGKGILGEGWATRQL